MRTRHRFQLPARTSVTALACLATALVTAFAIACGGDERGEASEKEAGPSATKIAAAVFKSLLSNTVEATQSEPAPPGPPPAPRDPRPDAMNAATQDATAETGADETCLIPYNGPVTIVPVRSTASINQALAERGRVPVVYATDDTAIWENGRVLTTDMENVGTHLNAVGWASNPMNIAGAGQRPGGSRANLGWNSGTSSFESGNSRKSRKPKRRRRRG